jgi:hypothetical protein
MTPGEENIIGPKEKIQILLAEYNTLRAEILTRTSNGFQVVAVAVALIALLLQKKELDHQFWIAVGIFVFGAVVCGWITVSAIGGAARRIVVIEKAVNSLAGDTLLVWETIHGEAFGEQRTGPFAFFVSLFDRLDNWFRSRRTKSQQ